MATKLATELQAFERREEEQASQQLAGSLKLPYITLVDYPILPDAISVIARDEALERHVVAYLKVGNVLHVASDRPTVRELPDYLKTLANRTQLKVALAVCSRTSFQAALAHYELSPVAKAVLEEATSGISRVAQADEHTPTYQEGLATVSALAERIQRVNTTELLDVLFSGALAMGATDVHLEPAAEELRVRFRIDGVLHQIVTLPHDSFETLRSRVKYLAQLKLDVRELPQDGRFEFRLSDRQVDVRTSSLPGLYGEIITLRLLPHNRSFLTLAELGFSPEQLATVTTAVRRPHGIILATGPTGSGKTTTLYALLATLNQPSVKIMTLEDPIEYRLPGVDQSQVNPVGQYTFAKALRSALRQDPDIIMVGEIRDGETASTSIDAALTGHLVLSTLHTNDAAGAIPRLLEMGVRPFLLSGVINLIIAQRLVRRRCNVCGGRGIEQNSGDRIQNSGGEQPPTLATAPNSEFQPLDSRTPVGCDVCHQTGYKGRVAIAELLVPNRAIEELIVKQGSTAAFAEAAEQAGMVPMATDGYAKVRAGLTTTAEIERVTGVSEPRSAA